MRVGAARTALGLGMGFEVSGGPDVEGVMRRVLGDGVVDRRREASQVDGEVGILHASDLARRELDVVGLGAGRREVGDPHVLTTDALGDVLERVEGRHDGQGLARRPVTPDGSRRRRSRRHSEPRPRRRSRRVRQRAGLCGLRPVLRTVATVIRRQCDAAAGVSQPIPARAGAGTRQ